MNINFNTPELPSNYTLITIWKNFCLSLMLGTEPTIDVKKWKFECINRRRITAQLVALSKNSYSMVVRLSIYKISLWMIECLQKQIKQVEMIILILLVMEKVMMIAKQQTHLELIQQLQRFIKELEYDLGDIEAISDINIIDRTCRLDNVLSTNVQAIDNEFDAVCSKSDQKENEIEQKQS